MNNAKGCLACIIAFPLAMIIGLIVNGVVYLLTGHEDFSSKIGFGAWMLMFMVFMLYGMLWFDAWPDSSKIPMNYSGRKRSRLQRAEMGLYAIEFSIAGFFAVIGASTAKMLNGETWMVVALALSCAGFGYCFGCDYKKRVMKRRGKGE